MLGSSQRMPLTPDCWQNSSCAVTYWNTGVLAAFHSISSRRATPSFRAMLIQLASLSTLSVWPFLTALYTEVVMPNDAACLASLG